MQPDPNLPLNVRYSGKVRLDEGFGKVVQRSPAWFGFELMPFQLVGLNWLLLLHRHGNNGVLADEMGLGKTVQARHMHVSHTNADANPWLTHLPCIRCQACALLAFIHKEGLDGGQGPHMVVAPASVLSSWQRTFAAAYPGLRVVLYHGSEADRRVVQLAHGLETCVLMLIF